MTYKVPEAERLLGALKTTEHRFGDAIITWVKCAGDAICYSRDDAPPSGLAQMDDYRHLQKTCETQAALSASPKARQALLEMAEEYGKRAEYREAMGGPLDPKAGLSK